MEIGALVINRDTMSKSNATNTDENIDIPTDGPRALITETEFGVLLSGPDDEDVTRGYYRVVRSRVKERAKRFAREFEVIDDEHPEAAGIIREAVSE